MNIFKSLHISINMQIILLLHIYVRAGCQMCHYYNGPGRGKRKQSWRRTSRRGAVAKEQIRSTPKKIVLIIVRCCQFAMKLNFWYHVIIPIIGLYDYCYLVWFNGDSMVIYWDLVRWWAHGPGGIFMEYDGRTSSILCSKRMGCLAFLHIFCGPSEISKIF